MHVTIITLYLQYKLSTLDRLLTVYRETPHIDRPPLDHVVFCLNKFCGENGKNGETGKRGSRVQVVGWGLTKVESPLERDGRCLKSAHSAGGEGS